MSSKAGALGSPATCPDNYRKEKRHEGGGLRDASGAVAPRLFVVVRELPVAVATRNVEERFGFFIGESDLVPEGLGRARALG
jgi:hypothetical protein